MNTNINLDNVTEIRANAGSMSLVVTRDDRYSYVPSFQCRGFWAYKDDAVQKIVEKFGGTVSMEMYKGHTRCATITYWDGVLDEVYI